MQQPVVDRAQVYNLALLMQHIYERHKQKSLQTIKIEIVGRTITCDNNYNVIVPESFKQPGQNHGICDVKHLKFIDAKYLHIFTEFVSNHVDRVLSLPLQFFVDNMLALVDLQHEFLVMQKFL